MTKHEAVDQLVGLANRIKLEHKSEEGQAMQMGINSIAEWSRLLDDFKGQQVKYKKEGRFFEAQVWGQAISTVESHMRSFGGRG